MSLADVLNFSDTYNPPANGQLIVPQNDGGSPTCNQSFYDPVMTGDTGAGGLAGNVPAPSAGSAAAGKFLKADGTFAVPPGGFTNPMTTEGDLIYGGASGVPTRLAGGTAGQLLSTDGSAGPPAWINAPAAALTFLDEVITMSGTSGSFAHTPVQLIGLFLNGQRLTKLGGSPDFSTSGTSITLTVAAVAGDIYEAVYYY
jgi:hypothetical protein